MAQVEINEWEANFIITLIKGSDPMGVYLPPMGQALKDKLIKAMQPQMPEPVAEDA